MRSFFASGMYQKPSVSVPAPASPEFVFVHWYDTVDEHIYPVIRWTNSVVYNSIKLYVCIEETEVVSGDYIDIRDKALGVSPFILHGDTVKYLIQTSSDLLYPAYVLGSKNSVPDPFGMYVLVVGTKDGIDSELDESYYNYLSVTDVDLRLLFNL